VAQHEELDGPTSCTPHGPHAAARRGSHPEGTSPLLTSRPWWTEMAQMYIAQVSQRRPATPVWAACAATDTPPHRSPDDQSPGSS
jgi:hypothetical protein